MSLGHVVLARSPLAELSVEAALAAAHEALEQARSSSGSEP